MDFSKGTEQKTRHYASTLSLMEFPDGRVICVCSGCGKQQFEYEGEIYVGQLQSVATRSRHWNKDKKAGTQPGATKRKRSKSPSGAAKRKKAKERKQESQISIPIPTCKGTSIVPFPFASSHKSMCARKIHGSLIHSLLSRSKCVPWPYTCTTRRESVGKSLTLSYKPYGSSLFHSSSQSMSIF